MSDKATCPGRDYQKDLEVCQLWPEKPWKTFLMDDTENEYWLKGPGFICPDDYCYFTKEDAQDIVFARTALPWYIKRCMELESQLQHAEEREVRYREALEKALNQWAMYADAERDFDGSYLDKSRDPEDMEAIIYGQCKQALSPSQPSRYREMEQVVEIVKKIGFHLVRHHGKECNCLYCQLYDALTAYDKAGEGAKQ